MLKIISASRRVDMVGFYPEKLISTLNERVPPEKVHTIVIWTKNPLNLIYHKNLRRTLKKYSQIFILLSITGMGGTSLEKGIPKTEKIYEILPHLIEFVKSPHRINIRFDPIVKLLMEDKVYLNYQFFPEIVKNCKKYGIKTFITSFMDVYPHVERNLKRYGITPLEFKEEEKRKIIEFLKKTSERENIELLWCAEKNLTTRGCIDGKLLNSLHPEGIKTTTEKASGQRQFCMCTKSWDIGWYYKCGGKCLYCYGNPDI